MHSFAGILARPLLRQDSNDGCNNREPTRAREMSVAGQSTYVRLAGDFMLLPHPRWQQYQQVAEVEVVLASNRPASDLKRTVRTPGTEVVAGDCFRRRHTAMTDLLLKSTGPVADQYKVLAGDQVVGHIRLSEAAPTATPWRWTLAYWQHKKRARTHGYGPTREAALQSFARSWHRE
jgi:hypothetical protein